MTARLPIAGCALLALAAGGAATGAASAASQPKPKTWKATVGAGYYAPSKLTVRPGDKVRWTWETNGFDLHDVNTKSGPAKVKSPTQSDGTWTKTFTKTGVYRLYCTQHGDMTMSVTVKKKR